MAKFSELEYVYNFGDPLKFRKVLVEIHIEEDSYMLKLFPENMVSNPELENVLVGLQVDLLNKIRINLTRECRVVIEFEGKLYNVKLSDGARMVKEIIPA